MGSRAVDFKIGKAIILATEINRALKQALIAQCEGSRKGALEETIRQLKDLENMIVSLCLE